ncbi:sensor histidine kinase [Streptoalloteichus hindustanus]|uniref:histidine kinase n=1 Tax=Streptoalloteichus hindustanus TaxID=2017 RepID=A0A1M5NYA5_STRHI|nr:ATP-binding protein [Streptoalloteichus hindustanus]SHG94520.1 Histidine kinase [Streptoalloteichus hindustanus]
MFWLVVSAVVAVAAAPGGAFWWPRHLTRGASVAFGLSIVVTAAYRGPGDNAGAGWLLLETAGQLCVLAQVVRRPPPRTAVTTAVIGVVAVAGSPLRIGLWLTPPSPPGEIVALCAVWALMAAAAVALGAYLRSLDRERVRSVTAARREQRLRLARDLHDWLAHEMTGIVLAAQAGQLDGTDQTRTLRQIEEAGTRGLDAMDRALRLLRSATDEPATGGPTADQAVTLAEVGAVVERFTESSRARVACEIADLDPPRPEIVATVHRVVVEALTNVRRHAPTASTVLVRVARAGADVVVEVTDDGVARSPRRRRAGGTGLAALADWVAAVDGRLTAGPARPHGWTVRAVVPT